jgi:hypothetical protein
MEGTVMVTLQKIRELLERVAFPTTKDEILATLTRLDAPAQVIERVQTLPEYRYGSVDSVLDTLRRQE